MSAYPPALLQRVVATALALGGLSVTAALGWLSLSLIDQVVLVGFGLVVPLVVGDLPWWWAATTAPIVVAFVLPTGAAAATLVLPLVGASCVLLLREMREIGPPAGWDLRTGADVLAIAYCVVAALALVQSRAGMTLLDLHEPIIELTTVHYTFAGVGALHLAARAYDGRRDSLAARVGVLCTAGAPPVVAVGFLTDGALPQIGGAVLMAIGVWITAALELADVASASPPIARVLLVVSGLAVWVPMALAVAWAAGQHWDVPALSIPDMARTHGLVNAFAFVLAGLVGRRLVAR